MANQPVARTIEPGITMFTAAEIRVAVVPIGNVPKEQMDEYLDKINKYRHVPLETAQSFYRETGKSPFQYMPWSTGCMHFRFLAEEDAKRKTRMVELHAQRQVLAVIGLGLGPATPDVRAAHEEYHRVCRQFPEALAHRCLVLEASEEQEAAAGQGWPDLFLLPPGKHLLETHLETCMLDMSMSILTEVEQWLLNASPSMMKLNTYIDSAEFTGQLAVLDDLQKLRMQVTDEEMKEKKKWGRLQKAKGDMCLLGGSPRDAANNYRSAMDLAKTTSDYVWYAAAVEGLAHSRIMEVLAVSSAFTGVEDAQQAGRASPDLSPMQRSDALIRKISAAGFGDRVMWRVLKEAGLEEEVKEMMLEARTWYRKRGGGMPLQVEQQLKLVRLLAGLKGLAARREATEMATWIMEQLASLHLPEDRLIAVGEAAQVLGMVGAARKRSLLLWHASDLCRGAEKLEHHALRIAIKALEPPDDPLQQDPDDQPKVHWTLRREVAVCRSWQAVHTAALATALAAARQASAHTEAWEVAALLLREHSSALDPADQQSLLNVMAQAAGCISAKAKVRPGQGPGPFVQLKRVLPPPPALQPIPMSLDAPGSVGGASQGPFIFKPPSVKRNNSLPAETSIPDWVCGDEAKVELYLANPLVEPLPLERLWLHVHVIPSAPLPAAAPSPSPGTAPPQPPPVCQCLPVQVTLPPNGKVARVTLSVIPQVPGQLQILGCKMVVWGVQWSQPFTTFLRKAATGILPQPRPAEPAVVTVLPPLPVLQATVQGPDVSITHPPPSELPTPIASPSPENRTASPSHGPTSPSTSSPTPGPRPTSRSGPIHVYEGQTLNWTLTLTNLSNSPIVALAVATSAPKGNPFRPLPGGLAPPGLQGAHLQAEDLPPDALPLQPKASLALPLRLTVGRAPAGSYDDIIVEARISYMSAPPEGPPEPPIDPNSPTPHTPKPAPQAVGRRLTIPIQLAINASLQPVSLRCVAQHAPLPDGQHMQHPASATVSGGAASDKPRAAGSGGREDAPLRCSSFAALEPYCGLHLGVRNCSDRYFRTWVAPLHAAASGPEERASTVHVIEPSTEATLAWPLLPPTHPSAASSVPSTPAAPHTPPSSLHSRGASHVPTDLTRCADHIAATWGIRWRLITASTGPSVSPPEGLLRLTSSDILEGITPLAATTVRSPPIHLTCTALPSSSGPPLALHNLSSAARALQPSCGMGDQLWGLRATCGEAVALELRGRSETERGARVKASMGVSTVEGDGVVEGQEGVAAAFCGACSNFQYELEPQGSFTHRVIVVMLRPGLHRLHVRDVRVKFDAGEVSLEPNTDPRSRRPQEPPGASFAQDPLYILCT